MCRFEQFGRRQEVRPGELMLNDLTAAYDVTWSGLGGSRCFQVPHDRLGLPLDVVRAAALRLRESPLYDLARQRLTEPDLGPERLAAAHNISRRQLYTVFRQAGLSLEQWLISQRLEGARADLTSAAGQHRTIYEISPRECRDAATRG